MNFIGDEFFHMIIIWIEIVIVECFVGKCKKNFQKWLRLDGCLDMLLNGVIFFANWKLVEQFRNQSYWIKGTYDCVCCIVLHLSTQFERMLWFHFMEWVIEPFKLNFKYLRHGIEKTFPVIQRVAYMTIFVFVDLVTSSRCIQKGALTTVATHFGAQIKID